MKLVSFHLMPYRPLDLAEAAKHRSPWVVLPNRLYDPVKGAEEYARHIDALVYAEELGFDAIGVNEHHQTAYGLMPAPNLIASALIQRTKTIKIAILGRALPLVNNPIYIAEEFAMLDNLSKGRIIAGFVRGIGSEYHSSGTNPYFLARTLSRGARPDHQGVDGAWPLRLRRRPFQLALRQPLAQALPEPASARLDPVAGIERDGRLGGRSQTQISVPGDVLVGGPRCALPQHLSRAGAAIRLRGGAGSTRLGLPDLRRRDRQARPPGGRAGGRDIVQRFPAPELRDADAARLHLDWLDEEFHQHAQRARRRQSHRRRSDRERHRSHRQSRTVLEGIERMRERTGFGILVALLQFGILSDDLTRRNMDLFAAEVMPHLRG
jgi:hypothetical protein